nr:hypothetical protein [Tanacetum cinerariifolium]
MVNESSHNSMNGLGWSILYVIMSPQSRRRGRSQDHGHEFTSEYGIPESLHPELPGPEEPIVEFPKGKQAVRKSTPQYYTKPLDSLKNWNNWFFWVDERVFPTVMKWRTSSPKDQMPSADMDLFSLISALNPSKVKTGTRPRAAPEVSLLTATANRVIDMKDTIRASESFRTPSILEKSPIDFANEDPPQRIAESGGAEGQVHDELAHGNQSLEDVTTVEVVPEPSLEKEIAEMGPPVNKRRRKKGKEKAEANALPKVLRRDHAAFRPA